MSKSITITDALTIFHVARLKLFIGSFKSAYKHALRDNDQYVISEIKAYRGDPLPRTTIQFEFFLTIIHYPGYPGTKILLILFHVKISVIHTLNFIPQRFCNSNKKYQILSYYHCLT